MLTWQIMQAAALRSELGISASACQAETLLHRQAPAEAGEKPCWNRSDPQSAAIPNAWKGSEQLLLTGLLSLIRPVNQQFRQTAPSKVNERSTTCWAFSLNLTDPNRPSSSQTVAWYRNQISPDIPSQFSLYFHSTCLQSRAHCLISALPEKQLPSFVPCGYFQPFLTPFPTAPSSPTSPSSW